MSSQLQLLTHAAPPMVSKLDAVEWLRSLAPESVDLIVTDPAYESLEKHRAVGTTTRLKVSDGSSNQWFPIFHNDRFVDLFAEMYRVLKPNAHLYFYCDQETMFVAKPIGEAAGFKFWKPIIWDKKKIGMGYHYRARYELILFFEKGKRKLNDLGIPDVLECDRSAKWICENCNGGRSACVDRAALEGSIRRVTSRSAPAASVALSTSSNGSDTTDQSQTGFRSTTRTKTSRTTRSRISSCSTQQATSESMADAICATGCGGSPVASASRRSRSTLITGTSPRMAVGQSLGAVDPVTSETSSDESNSSACPCCGQPRRRGFPTEKPVDLSKVLIGQSSEAGELVIDPFLGSGSTGVAAIELGRRFAGTDISDDSIKLASGRLATAGKAAAS